MRTHPLLLGFLLPVAVLAQAPATTAKAPASAPASVPASASASTAARPGPMRLGQMQIWTLQDAQFPLEASLLKGLEAAEARRMLGGKDAALTPANAFLVRLNGKNVLVDTGVGKSPEVDSGHLPERLAEAGLTPADIDLIVITHFHFDHIGGLLKADGTRAFPKAKLLVPRSEQAFWFEDPAKLPEQLRERVPRLKAICAAYEQAGAFKAFEDGAELTPGLRALPAHGHTGGHTVYAFSSEGKELWCLGDLMHFGAVQFERPEVGVAFDADGTRAVGMRQELFKKAAQAKAVLAGAHLPKLVRIEAKGSGYQVLPVQP